MASKAVSIEVVWNNGKETTEWFPSDEYILDWIRDNAKDIQGFKS